ncbi:TetR/AcrR family transcriptional regulator [Uliginosibacterium gangwonense]|uniref:TetR/AcrR family transcriptional regulator n=1 Tax=Uliginosibacterium gangwonense TaxID=392736 RepID=UPI00036D3646|nr:TetR/AcrR family transcriptional regulator [Uliginosibacterium gangwonense]
MRHRSEEKREAILEAAAQVFGEVGFERASMTEISARAGGARATIYSYFESKEELFFDAMLKTTAAEFEATHQALESGTENVEEALKRFGHHFLSVLYSPEVQAIRRVVIAEAGRSNLGQLCFERGVQKSDARVAEFLDRAILAGKIKPTNTKIATKHLCALLEAEFTDYFHFQIAAIINDQTINAAVARAVEVFMAAYQVSE